MFNKLSKFLWDFHHNSGSWIMAASLFNKLVHFLVKAFVLIYISKAVFGQLTYALSVISFFTPFVGMGSPAGLLRYGSKANDSEKEQLKNYAFSTGLLFSFLIMALMLAGFLLFKNEKVSVLIFLIVLSFRVLSLFLYNHQSVQMRIDEQNKRFGVYDMMSSIALLILAVVATYFYHAQGYVFALVMAPILIFLIYSWLFGFPKFSLKSPLGKETKSFWFYSFLSSFTSVIAQMVFLVDIYIIEHLMTDLDVAEYGAATLIPMNILVLPLIFMRTDFTKIAQNDQNPKFLRNYYYQYFLLFLLICLVGMLISYFLGEWIFSFLGNEYSPYKLFLILMLGACSAILMRIPLTGIISALGHAKVNTITGIITLILSVSLNFLWIPKYGLEGAAWATTLSLFISGIMSWIYFEWYLRSLKND